MTMLYRVQSHPPEHEWVTEWFTTLPSAINAMRAQVALGFETHVDLVVVPTDKKQLCEAMNQANVNRETWPGEMVAREKP